MNRRPLSTVGNERERKGVSVMLSAFSAQEWMLSSSITSLMDLVVAFPDVPSGFENVRGQQAQQLVIAQAADVVNSVRSLSSACLASLRYVQGSDKLRIEKGISIRTVASFIL